MNDCEAARRELTGMINEQPKDRATLEAVYGPVWDTAELQRDFTVVGFLAPFVEVVRKADGARGLLTFQHAPRFYWGFIETR